MSIAEAAVIATRDLKPARTASQSIQHRLSVGDHGVFHVHNDHGIREHIRGLYPVELDTVHTSSDEWTTASNKAHAGEVDVDLHRRFYKGKEKEAFKTRYLSFLSDVGRHFYPDEHAVIVQAFPNIRFHMPGTVTVPRHRDSDATHNRTPHPKGVRNFLYALTRMEGTSSMYIESVPRKGDFQPLEMVCFESNSMIASCFCIRT